MLGVHFAVTAEQERELLAAADTGDTDGLADLLENIEEGWDRPELSVATDKAWDAIHRCLGGGTLDPDDGGYPLSHAVLGGRHLHDEYYVVHVTAAEAHDVAAALQNIDETWLRSRYDALAGSGYDGPHDEADFEYTWTGFADLCEFYRRAAEHRRAVVFTAI